jgi:3-oxoadipate enol-lactonase
VPDLETDDATLHVEVDGSGEPVTVFAHGLTNSCMELAAFTPFAPGTKVRFCFRGHGHSSAPPAGAYGFADLARDVRAVADAYGATCAFGTSMGAGAITHVLGSDPDRFERLVFLLPAALDVPLADTTTFDRNAELLETLEKEHALERMIGEGAGHTWMRDLAMQLWQDADPVAIARAIREVVRDVAIDDRRRLGAVEAPVLLICQERDRIHPVAVGEALAEAFPNAQLVVYPSSEALFAAIPELIQRVGSFLAEAA